MRVEEIKKIHLTGVVFSVIFITASASGLQGELWFKTRDKKTLLHSLSQEKTFLQSNCMHCKEDAIYVFPEIKMRGLVSYFIICEQFIYSQDRSTYFAAAKQGDLFQEYINRSQIYSAQFRIREYLFGSSVLFGSSFHKLVYKVGTGENMRYILYTNSHPK